jgi:2-polyprenyl-3-methyl-5-hydroxy-6-metoxy-1,4-benzoquinol methylase
MSVPSSASASAEFHVCESDPSAADLDRATDFWRPYLGRRVLDIGCGEGHLVAALCRAGYAAEGVDLTPELAARAAARGVKVAVGNALEYLKKEGGRFDSFLMLDFVEHLPFDQVAAILDALPRGSRCIIQTPNTNSIIGHQFYLQVPGHITPLSPAVLRKMLERAGLRTVATGTLWGGLPWKGLRRRATLFFLEKVFGVTMLPLLVEGAGYYVVADKPAT